jgi:hypothetical protein
VTLKSSNSILEYLTSFVIFSIRKVDKIKTKSSLKAKNNLEANKDELIHAKDEIADMILSFEEEISCLNEQL